MAAPSVDYTPQLRTLMTQVEISSFNQLSQLSGVPRSQLVKIRRGAVERIPWGSFMALAQVLKVSPQKVLETFGAIEPPLDGEAMAGDGLLNPPLMGDVEPPLREWEQRGLDILESLILQLPTAAFAAKNNPTAPAVRLLPLLKPLDQLLTNWDVKTIGQVGEAIAFNPQYHQWMGGSERPEKDSLVKVRYVGYFHGDRLLHRAKVGPL